MGCNLSKMAGCLGTRSNRVSPAEEEIQKPHGSRRSKRTQTPKHDIFELYKRGSITADTSQTKKRPSKPEKAKMRRDTGTSPLEPYDFGKPAKAKMATEQASNGDYLVDIENDPEVDRLSTLELNDAPGAVTSNNVVQMAAYAQIFEQSLHSMDGESPDSPQPETSELPGQTEDLPEPDHPASTNLLDDGEYETAEALVVINHVEPVPLQEDETFTSENAVVPETSDDDNDLEAGQSDGPAKNQLEEISENNTIVAVDIDGKLIKEQINDTDVASMQAKETEKESQVPSDGDASHLNSMVAQEPLKAFTKPAAHLIEAINISVFIEDQEKMIENGHNETTDANGKANAIANEAATADDLVDAHVDSPAKTAVEAPADTSVDTPGDSAPDAPTDTPTDAIADALTDTTADVPVDASADDATDAPADTPVDAPDDAPTDAPTDGPVDTPTNAPTDVPDDAPADIPADAHIDITASLPGNVSSDETANVPADAPANAAANDTADAPTDANSNALTDAFADTSSDASAHASADSHVPVNDPANVTEKVPPDVNANASMDTPPESSMDGKFNENANAPIDEIAKDPPDVPPNVPSDVKIDAPHPVDTNDVAEIAADTSDNMTNDKADDASADDSADDSANASASTYKNDDANKVFPDDGLSDALNNECIGDTANSTPEKNANEAVGECLASTDLAADAPMPTSADASASANVDGDNPADGNADMPSNRLPDIPQDVSIEDRTLLDENQINDQ